MKNKFSKLVFGLAAVLILAACGGGSGSEGSQTSVEPDISAEHFDIAINEIANTVPLAIERTTGTTIATNDYRNAQNPVHATPVLSGGNDLLLSVGGKLNYEDEDNEVYIYSNFEVSWSYREDDTLAAFTFKEETNNYVATPGYPVYSDENDKPNPIVGRLYATVSIASQSKRLSIDVILDPVLKIETYGLDIIRDMAADKEVVRVRGYVTGVFVDWNTAGIVDGEWGIGVYQIAASGFDNSFKVGDLIEVVGQFGFFSGVAQLSFISNISVLNPEEWPDVLEPVVTEWTHDQLRDSLKVVNGKEGYENPDAPLYDKDNSLVKFASPFKFLRVEDRNAVNVGFAGFDVSGSKHTNVILEGKDSDGVAFEVILSMNYHMKEANQTAFKTFLEANQNNEFYYEGPLSSFNKFVLGPYHFEGTLRVA